MKLTKKLLLLLCVFAFAVACSATEEPTAEPTIELVQPTAIPTEEQVAEPVEEPTEAPTAAPEPTAVPTEIPTEEPAVEEVVEEEAVAQTTEGEGAADAEAPAPSVPTTYLLDTNESTVTFIIDEVLNGNDKTVEGVGAITGGSVTFNPGDLSTAAIAPIIINAASFVTDSNNRNGAIRRFILQTDDNPLILFTPTALNGLPDTVAPGETITFEIVGDLMVRGTTNSETFAASVTWVDASTVTGTADTEILYADYGLNIPSVPFVASVEDNLLLQIDFTAAAAE